MSSYPEQPTLINIFDYEKAAYHFMPDGLYDFVSGGALDEMTLRNNHEAFNRLKIQYRVLQSATQPSLTTTILDKTIDLPIILAPTGSQKLTHPEGELAVRRAADQANTIMTVATTSTYSMEAICNAGSSPIWFQLYLFKDNGLNEEIVARAETSGFQAIALTVDAPVFGKRERDIRNSYTLPPGLEYENLPMAGESGGRDVSSFMNENWKRSIGWSDVEWLAKRTKLPVFVKGISHPRDAHLSIEHGANGIWVSNHGGRQLDSAPATIEVLPTIARMVAQRVPIILDGGIRRGLDVLKALALGATAVAIGRPMLWGLAVAGQKGVNQILTILKEELENGMTLCGISSIQDITKELIFNCEE